MAYPLQPMLHLPALLSAKAQTGFIFSFLQGRSYEHYISILLLNCQKFFLKLIFPTVFSFIRVIFAQEFYKAKGNQETKQISGVSEHHILLGKSWESGSTEKPLVGEAEVFRVLTVSDGCRNTRRGVVVLVGCVCVGYLWVHLCVSLCVCVLQYPELITWKNQVTNVCKKKYNMKRVC